MTAPTQATAREAVEQIQEALDANPMEGPWSAAGPSFGDALPRYLNEVVIDDGSDSPDTVCMCDPAGDPESSATMDYIAACNPENIRAVLALLAAKQEEVDKMRATGDELVRATNYRQGVMASFHTDGDKMDFANSKYWEAFDAFRAALSPSQGNPK